MFVPAGNAGVKFTFLPERVQVYPFGMETTGSSDGVHSNSTLVTVDKIASLKYFKLAE